MSKRPKAAIPIVDPSLIIVNNDRGGTTGEILPHQNSLDSTDQMLISTKGAVLPTTSNQEGKLVEGGSNSVRNNMMVSDTNAKPLTAI